jgi:hypothetical protein
MNRKISLGDLSGGNLLSKLPKSITPINLVLMVVGVILLALTVYFAVTYFGAVSDRNDLDNDITQKQQQISGFGGLQNIATLQSQLDQALQDLMDESPFPTNISDTEIAYSIIKAEEETTNTCYQYDTLSANPVDLNNGTYVQNRYSISSQGEEGSTGVKLIRIIRFVEELEGSYDTATVSGLVLSDSEGDGEWTFDLTYSIVSMPQE